MILNTNFWLFVFYEIISQMQPQEETEERFRKQRLLYQQILETKGTVVLAGLSRKHARVIRRQKTRGAGGRVGAHRYLSQGLYWGFRQGRVNSLGLAGLNNFDRLWL